MGAGVSRLLGWGSSAEAAQSGAGAQKISRASVDGTKVASQELRTSAGFEASATTGTSGSGVDVTRTVPAAPAPLTKPTEVTDGYTSMSHQQLLETIVKSVGFEATHARAMADTFVDVLGASHKHLAEELRVEIEKLVTERGLSAFMARWLGESFQNTPEGLVDLRRLARFYNSPGGKVMLHVLPESAPWFLQAADDVEKQLAHLTPTQLYARRIEGPTQIIARQILALIMPPEDYVAMVTQPPIVMHSIIDKVSTLCEPKVLWSILRFYQSDLGRRLSKINLERSAAVDAWFAEVGLDAEIERLAATFAQRVARLRGPSTR